MYNTKKKKVYGTRVITLHKLDIIKHYTKKKKNKKKKSFYFTYKVLSVHTVSRVETFSEVITFFTPITTFRIKTFF
jgi:hypothetical protein